jgi:hypothetical protein
LIITMIPPRWLARRMLRWRQLRPVIESVELGKEDIFATAVFLPWQGWPLRLLGEHPARWAEVLRRKCGKPGFQRSPGGEPLEVLPTSGDPARSPSAASSLPHRLELRWQPNQVDLRRGELLPRYAGRRLALAPDFHWQIGDQCRVPRSTLWQGRVEGFSPLGSLLGWTAPSVGSVRLCWGDTHSIPIEAGLERADLTKAGLAGGRGFEVRGSDLLAVARALAEGETWFRLEDGAGGLIGAPVHRLQLLGERPERLPEAWLGQISIRRWHQDPQAHRWLLEQLDSIQAPVHQPDVWAEVYSRLQNAYGAESTTNDERRAHAEALMCLFAAAAHTNPIWRDAQSVFTIVWLQELLRSRCLSLLPGLPPHPPLDAAALSRCREALSFGWRPASTGFMAKASHDFLRASLEGLLRLACRLRHERVRLPSAEEALLSQLMAQAQVLMGIDEGPMEEWQRLTEAASSDPSSAALLARYKRGHDLRVQLEAASAPQLLQDPTTADAWRASRLRLARTQGMDADGLMALTEGLCSDLPPGDLGVETTCSVEDVIERLGNDLLAGPSPQEHWPDVAGVLRQRRLRRIDQVLRLDAMAHGPIPRPSRRPGERRQVLVIGNQDIPQVYRYRQQKIVADLRTVGRDELVVQNVDDWESLNSSKMGTRLLGVDLLVVCRLPATASVLPLLLNARQQSIPIVVDVDDPIFDAEIFPPPLETYAGTISADLHASMHADTANWLGILRLANVVTTTTEPLRQSVIRCTGLDGERVRLHPNLMLPELLEEARADAPSSLPGQLTLVYGSGTKAHKQVFLGTVLPALMKLKQKHPTLRIRVIGMTGEGGSSFDLAEPPALTQLEWLPATGYRDYLRQLHGAQISIAPLESNGATDCKSELKWFEAALLGAAIVVSPTAAYRQLLRDGEGALFATTTDDWFLQLNRLVLDRPLRERLVGQARAKALEAFAPWANEPRWRDLLQGLDVMELHEEATAA